MLLTLTDCTIYTRNDDGTYTRQITKCHWQDVRGISYSGGGLPVVMDNDEIAVMIPLEEIDLPIISSKSKYNNYIVRGIVEDEVDNTNVSETMQRINALKIKRVNRVDYALGPAQNHWEVYAE